ncbi:hypothetical protein GGX14DRAFT_396659 [Mycena pura]|uniref:Uncharacterized protein n=1 Tax=Mycena pura TaxID=153505 RepID=A0AAD6VAG6_9AGAR|nr:hypothetical protein GGX14DRAFT_396659 [Mycena pura]
MSTASGRQQGSEVLRNMGADECGEVHPGGRRSKRECCNTAKFPLGTRPGSELIGAKEAERAWPQLVRCAVPYAWCPISEDEDKRENISSTPSGDPSSGPKPRPERGPRPWEANRSGRGAEAKTSVIQECIAKMRQSFGHMHQNKAEKSRKASESRRVERGCAAKLHERTEMKRSEAPKFNDQYRSNRLKAIGCERALGSKGFGQLHQRADGTAHKCARTERAGRKQTQGSEDRGWLYRARMSSRGVVGVPRSKRGGAGRVYKLTETWCRPNVAEPKSQAGEWLGVPRIITKGSDEVSECRRCIGETALRCGQDLWASRDWVQAQCNRTKALAKASALRLAWAWWPCGRRAQPHLGVDRSTDAPERKGGREVQDDKTPRRSNDADGPGRRANDHQLRVGKSLGVPSIATGVRGCSRGHRGTAGRPRVMTSSGGVEPGNDIINLSRSDSDEIKRARDVTPINSSHMYRG